MMHRFIRTTIFLTAVIIGFTSIAVAEDNSKTLSDNSVYHLDSKWTTHRGKTVNLKSFAGEPTIVVMFYGHCKKTCPLLIRNARKVYSEIPENIRDSVNVLAITIDPKRDSPEKLKAYAEDKDLDKPNWYFLHGNETDIRQLATAIGFEYRERSDGMFDHTNVITVLDKKGSILGKLEKINTPVDKVVPKIRSQLE
jgi:protein SCO1/2